MKVMKEESGLGMILGGKLRERNIFKQKEWKVDDDSEDALLQQKESAL